MLFRRRTPLSFVERLRRASWPQSSWSRSLQYFRKRVLRLSASPHAIGIGFACGVAVSWTPFVGFHFLMSALIAFFLGGNLLASAIGTAVGNPLTFPFMWWLAYEVGHRFLGIHGGAFAAHWGATGKSPLDEFIPILEPMLIGALPLGIVSGGLAYLIVSAAVRAYQHARRERLAARRASGGTN
jgi:uncharacterized protein